MKFLKNAIKRNLTAFFKNLNCLKCLKKLSKTFSASFSFTFFEFFFINLVFLHYSDFAIFDYFQLELSCIRFAKGCKERSTCIHFCASKSLRLMKKTRLFRIADCSVLSFSIERTEQNMIQNSKLTCTYLFCKYVKKSIQM